MTLDLQFNPEDFESFERFKVKVNELTKNYVHPQYMVLFSENPYYNELKDLPDRDFCKEVAKRFNDNTVSVLNKKTLSFYFPFPKDLTEKFYPFSKNTTLNFTLKSEVVK